MAQGLEAGGHRGIFLSDDLTTQVGTFALVPHALSFSERPTLVTLLLLSLAAIVASSLLVGRTRDALTSARRRLELHAWHLRHLVPTEARDPRR